MKSRPIRLFILAFVFWFMFGPATALACGPSTVEAIFVFTVHPAFPLERFAKGELGVVQPSFARSYLYVAHRYLENRPFATAEVKMLTELWEHRLGYRWSLNEEEWIKSWHTAREKVPGLSKAPEIRVYRNRAEPNQYETFLNCQKDSFDTAVETLNARITKYGAASPLVKDWVVAQDQVFSNCSEGQQLPSPVPDGTNDQLARADREYQLAAANFYSTNFDEATRQFEQIAANNRSPWRTIAPYLAARSLVRKASLAASENKSQPLSDAETRLNRVLANKELATTHAATARLLDLVRLRLRPSERLHELAQKLSSRTENRTLKQDLWDYTTLLDSSWETDQNTRQKALEDLRGDDVTDWILTLQSETEEATTHALSKWRSGRSEAWLVAALSKLTAANTQSNELIEPALAVKASSSAFPSAQFHAIRLLIETGKRDIARSRLDQLLTTHQQRFERSSLNLLMAQRMSLASSLGELINFAPRLPATISWNDDGRELPGDLAVDDSPEIKATKGKQFFDVDAVSVFNRQLPLAVLKEATKSTTLPVHLRRDLTQAVWLRAVILNDFKTADEVAPTLKQLVPEIASHLDEFLAAQEPGAKKFAAIYAWLKFPGLEPIVDRGIGREAELKIRDSYRDNWWCSAAGSSYTETDDEEDDPPSFTALDDVQARFLSPTQVTAATREYSALQALGAGPNYISRQVVEQANKNPKDPRLAEALHLAVYTARYGCTDKNSGRWSKAAFDTLHRQYPNSTWAKKTKYWFKD